MIDAQELIDCVANYNPKSSRKLLLSAFNYGQEKHEGQFRRSGEPYFSHPLSVALILAEQKLDDATMTLISPTSRMAAIEVVASIKSPLSILILRVSTSN